MSTRLDDRLPTCWSCSAPMEQVMAFCPACNSIQPLQPQNHFDRLGMLHGFNIEMPQLEKSYFGWQRKLHPDRFARRSEAERQYSLQHSMAINEAYEVLKNSLKRAQYLLHLNGVEVNTEKDTLKPTQVLLTEIMELREALMDASSPAEIEKISTRAVQEKENGQQILSDLLEKQNWEEAGHMALRLNYLSKLLDDIRIAKVKGTA